MPASSNARSAWQATTPDPALRDGLRAGADTRLPIARAKLVGREEAFRDGVDDLCPRDVDGTGDMSGDGVDRFGLAPVASGRAHVDEHDVRERSTSVHGSRVDDGVGRPWLRRECRAGWGFGLTGRDGPAPGREPAVEDRGGSVKGAEHPPQTCRDRPGRVVVDDDRRLVADAGAGHRVGEGLRRGKRVPSTAAIGPDRRGEVGVDVHIDGPGDVRFEEAALPGPVGVPAHVGDDQLGGACSRRAVVSQAASTSGPGRSIHRRV